MMRGKNDVEGEGHGEEQKERVGCIRDTQEAHRKGDVNMYFV